MAEMIITDDNYLSLSRPPQDYATGHIARDWEIFEYGAVEFAEPFPIPLIPRSEWPDRIADLERRKALVSDAMKDAKVPVLNQGSLPYCHAFAPAAALMGLRAIQGLPFKMLSAGSIGGPATGYKATGAWIGSDLKVIRTLGVSTTEFVPEKQVSRSGWKPGAAEEALTNRVIEWYELPRQQIFDYMMTALLLGFPVCDAYTWWGHATFAADPYMSKDRKFGHRNRNSWGPGYGEDGWFVMMEGKGTPYEAYVPRVITPS